MLSITYRTISGWVQTVSVRTENAERYIHNLVAIHCVVVSQVALA